MKIKKGIAEWYGIYLETFLGKIPIFGWIYFNKNFTNSYKSDYEKFLK